MSSLRVHERATVQRPLRLRCEAQLWEILGFQPPIKTFKAFPRSGSWRKRSDRLNLLRPKRPVEAAARDEGDHGRAGRAAAAPVVES
jgi:hypothetical protein